jgi:hypothetical protein
MERAGAQVNDACRKSRAIVVGHSDICRQFAERLFRQPIHFNALLPKWMTAGAVGAEAAQQFDNR